MAWRQYANGTRAYSAFMRIGGRPSRLWFGRGAVAQHAAELHAAWQFARKIDRERIDGIKEQIRTLDGFVIRFSLLASYLFAAVLTAAGYSLSAGSRWRRTREGNGAPTKAILDLDVPLRSAPGLGEMVSRSAVLQMIQHARPPEGNYWWPAVAALEEQRHRFGSRVPAAQEEIGDLLRSRPEIWTDALRMGAGAIGVMSEKLAAMRKTDRDAVLWDAMRGALEGMPDENVSFLHAVLGLRRVACLLWADHAADFFQFVVASFPAGLPAHARERLTRADHHLHAAYRLERKLQRLLELDDLAVARRQARKYAADAVDARPPRLMSGPAVTTGLESPAAISLGGDS